MKFSWASLVIAFAIVVSTNYPLLVTQDVDKFLTVLLGFGPWSVLLITCSLFQPRAAEKVEQLSYLTGCFLVNLATPYCWFYITSILNGSNQLQDNHMNLWFFLIILSQLLILTYIVRVIRSHENKNIHVSSEDDSRE